MTRAELDKLIEALVKLRDSATDEQAADAIPLYPEWRDDETYLVGQRVRFKEKLYKCLQGHTSMSHWNPGDAPSLWAEVLPGQGGTEVGEWVQPGATNPYMKGDRVKFNGKVYESTIDNNVWSPAAYPAGWKEV